MKDVLALALKERQVRERTGQEFTRNRVSRSLSFFLERGGGWGTCLLCTDTEMHWYFQNLEHKYIPLHLEILCLLVLFQATYYPALLFVLKFLAQLRWCGVAWLLYRNRKSIQIRYSYYYYYCCYYCYYILLRLLLLLLLLVPLLLLLVLQLLVLLLFCLSLAIHTAVTVVYFCRFTVQVGEAECPWCRSGHGEHTQYHGNTRVLPTASKQ